MGDEEQAARAGRGAGNFESRIAGAGKAWRGSRRCGGEVRGGIGRGGLAGWPGWARVIVSLALLYHMAAVLAGALGVPPSSELEQTIADTFAPYFDLMDLGYSYRFYAEPPPTPVVTATLQFGDGRPEETVRLPGRVVAGPRMRHQRQLALANSLLLRRPGGQAADQGREPEPVGPRLCPPPLSFPARLPERDPARAAALDPRPGAGAQGDGRARRNAIRPLR